MGVQRRTTSTSCATIEGRQTASKRFILRAYSVTVRFWLNIQRRSDLWEAMQSLVNVNGQTRTSAGNGGLTASTRQRLSANNALALPWANLDGDLWRQLIEARR